MILLKNGFVVDPENNIFSENDILIENGKIKKIAQNIEKSNENMLKYNMNGKHIFPGFIDMHVHLREPGREDKETILTGVKSAVAGGFIGVAPMPNTTPICDNKTIVDYLKNKEKEYKLAKIYPIGAVSKNENGKELAAIGEMHRSGIVGVSDDGCPVASTMLARRAFEYIKKFDLPLISHSEDKNLSKDGVMNEGLISLKLGLGGIPNAAEEIMVARDIILCEMTKSKLHIAHASTKGSLRMIEDAKNRGVNVTVEITPHHFSLTDEEVETQLYSTATKVNPPLRTQGDVDYIVDCIKNGVVDIIATDHAPHTKVDKSVEYDFAPFGISGLESAVGLVTNNLYYKDIIDLKGMANLLSINPRKRFNIDGGIKEGKIADITIIDMEKEWTINKNEFYSKGKNTPFDGQNVKGKPYMTIVNGRVCMYEGKIF